LKTPAVCFEVPFLGILHGRKERKVERQQEKGKEDIRKEQERGKGERMIRKRTERRKGW
jgi:hypothetical protein